MKPLDLTGLEDGPQAAGLNLEALDEPTSNKVGDGVAAAASGQFVPARFAAAVNPETPYPGVDRFGSQIGPARSLGTLGEAGRMLRESLPATMVLGRSENQRLQDLQAQGSAGLNPPALDYRGQRTDQAGNLLPSVAKPVEVTEDTGALPSLARGVVGLGKIGVGLGLQAQDIAGIKGGPLPGWAADLKAITDEMQPEVGEFKNIGRGFTADERGALARRGAAYLQEAVMENLPMMVPSLVSGALALVFGRNLIKAAAARAMEAAAADSAAREALNHAARNLGVQAAEKHFIKAAGKAAAERATLAAQVAGATAGSVALESGNIYADMAEEGHRGRTQALVAAGAAVPAGVLDTLGEVMALRRLQGAPLGSAVARLAEKALGKPMVERGVVKLGVAGVEQFIAEAPTEFLQEAIEQAAKVSQDPAAQGAFWSKWWDTAPQWREAGIKGGLGGLGIGVGSGAIGAVVTGRGGESSKVKDQQSMVAVETEAPAVEGVDYLPDAGGVDPVEELVGEAQSSKLKAQTEIVPGPDYQPMEGQPFETDEPLPLPPQPAEGERQKAKGKSEVVPGPDYQPLEGQPFETDEPLPPVTEPSPPVVVPGVVPGTGLDLSGLEPDEWALDYGDGGTLPEVQPWPKLPEPPKAGNRENKNIGRTWNSRFGKQTIVGVESVPAGDYYDVRDESGAVRVYPGGQLEDRIKRDEYEMTPEYAQERAAAEQKRKTDAERAAKVEAQEAKNRTELSQFTANDNPMVAGKKHAALLRVFSFDGVPMTVKAKVEELVLAGERANVTEEPALKEMTRAQFNRATEAEQKEHDRRRKAAGNKSVYRVGGYDVGKTAFEYARYLEGMLPKSASGTLETAVPPVAPAATPGGVTTAPEPSYISPKEIQERFAAESERAAAKQSETVAKMGAEEEAWRNRPRKQTGEELQKEWEAQQNAKKLAKEAAPAPPAVAAEVRKPEVVKEKQAVAPLAAKAQKKFLLEEIDKALAEAPDVEVTPYPVQGNETSERRDELKKQYAAALAADKARVGTVTIEVPGDGAFEILNTRKALQAFKAKAAKFPTTVPKKAEPGKVRETPTAAPVVGKMEPGAALKAARMVVSEDTEREVINHVWSDGQQSVATDGARMMIVQAGNGGTAKAPVLVREDGKTEPAKNRGKDAKGNKKGDFPDWRAVVPKESIERGNGLDTGRLWTVLKQALAVWIGHKETQHSVTLVRNKDGSIGLMTSAPEAGYYVHNVQPGWQSIVAVNGEYLADGLAAARMVGNEKVAISWTDEMAPVVIDGKGFKYVVMPMRLNGGRIEEVAKQEAERVAKMEELAGAARGEGKRQKAKGESEEGATPDGTATDKLIAKLEGMKSSKHRGEVGAFNLPGISEAMWNTALDAGIGLLKAGRAIGEAIDAVVAKLRELGADFDEANVRQAVADGLGIGFRGVHKAPDGTHGEASLDAINRTYPDDIYSPDGARFYGDGISARRDAAMHRMIVAAKGNPAAKVTVYRSVPKGQAGEILPGDWVTPSREYAADHGARFAGGMTILKREVRAGDLFTEGNSIYEFGWSPKGAGVEEFIAKLEGMKSSKHRGEVGAFNLPGVTEAVWNTALDAGIQLLKLGRSIGEAIDAVVAKLRELGADFDEANVRQAVAIQLGEEPLREHAIKQLHAGNRNAAVQAAILAASTRDVRSDDEVDAAVAGIIREAGGAEAALPVVNDVRLPLDTRYALALAVANQLNDEVMRLTGQQPAGWLAESNRLAQLVGKFLGEFIPTTTETARGLRQLARLKAMGRQTPIGWDTFARTTIENVNAEQRARLAPTLQSLIEELNRLNAEVARATAETKAVQDAARQAAAASVRAEAERQGSEIRNAMVIETTNSIELLPSVRKAKAAATVKALQKIGGAGYWQGLVNKGQAALVKAIEQALVGSVARVNAVTVAEIAQLMTRVLRQQVDATLGTAAQKRQGLPALMKLRVLFGANERMSDFWRGVRGQLANELTEKYGERPEIEALLGQTMDVWSGPLVRAAMKEVLAEQETNLGGVIREHLRGVGTGSIEAARATLAAKIVEAVGLDEQTGERLARAVEAEFDAEMRKQQGKVAERLRKAEENRRKAAAAVPTRKAEQIIKQLAKSQSDTLTWAQAKVDAVRAAVLEQLKTRGLADEDFKAKLVGLGVKPVAAGTLTQVVAREIEVRNRLAQELMFGEDAIDKAIRKALTATGQQLGRIVRTHHSEQAGVGKALAERLVAEAGLTGPAAERLAAAVLGRFKQLAEQRKRRIVEQMTKPRTARELRKRTVADRIIEASNLGALDAETTWKALAEKLGLAVYTPEHAAEVRRRAELLQRLPAGSVQRIQATARLLAFIAKAHGVKASELAWAVWYANMLAAWGTMTANAIGSVWTVAAAPWVAGRLNPKLAWIGGVEGLKGLVPGALEAAAILRYGSEAKRLKFDERQHALEQLTGKGFFGAQGLKQLRYVGRILAATDALFYMPAHEVRSAMIAHALAKEEGLSGAELARRRDEILHGTDRQEMDWRAQIDREALAVRDAGLEADRLWRARRLRQLRESNRSEAMQRSADSFALTTTYNNEPTGLIGAVAGAALYMRHRFPQTAFMVPFVNIVANVANESINYTPWGFARGLAGSRVGVGSVTAAWNEKMREGKTKLLPEEVLDLHVKAALGTLAVAAVAMAAAAGLGDDDKDAFQLYGAGPRRADGKIDGEKAKQLKETGWLPYSVRVGGRYYSFQTTPLVVPFGILGNYLDARRYQGEKWDQVGALDHAAFALWSGIHVVSAMSFIESVGRFFDWVSTGSALDKGGDALAREVGRTAGNMVFPRGLHELDRALDPTVYDGRGIGGALAAAVPFTRAANEKALGGLGTPVQRGVMDRFTNARIEGLMADLTDRNLWLGIPDRKEKMPLLERELNDKEWAQYVELYGTGRLRKDGREVALPNGGIAASLERYPQWRTLPREEAQARVNRIVAVAHYEARLALGWDLPVTLPNGKRPMIEGVDVPVNVLRK